MNLLFTERREQPSLGETQMKNKAITRKMSLLILRKKKKKKIIIRHIRTKSLFVKYVDIVVSIYAFFNESGSINNTYVK